MASVPAGLTAFGPLAPAAGASSSADCAVQYCPAGAIQAACARVLVVGSDPSAGPWLADVQSSVQATAAFATVDTFAALLDTPSASLLAGYDAVLAFSNDLFANGALLGDRLAAYHDQGGGVVVALFGNAAGFSLLGAYGAVGNGYALMD